MAWGIPSRVEALASLVVQIAYPAVTQSAFGLFSCYPLADGTRTFTLAPHLDCDSDEARVTKAVGVASLVMWGLAFPILLGLLVIRKGCDAKYSFIIVSYGDTSPGFATGLRSSASKSSASC